MRLCPDSHGVIHRVLDVSSTWRSFACCDAVFMALSWGTPLAHEFPTCLWCVADPRAR